MGVLIFLLIVILLDFNWGLKDNQILLLKEKIEINGEYGEELSFDNIKSIELKQNLPKIATKIHGFSLETIKKGIFRTNNNEKVKLLINSNKTPIILFVTIDNKKIYYSSKNGSNEAIFQQLKEWQKKID